MWKYIVWSSHRYTKCVVVLVIEGFFGFPPLQTQLAELQAKIVELENTHSTGPWGLRNAEQAVSYDGNVLLDYECNKCDSPGLVFMYRKV